MFSNVFHKVQGILTSVSVQANFKGIYLPKALTCMKMLLYKQELLFVKETYTFGHNAV